MATLSELPPGATSNVAELNISDDTNDAATVETVPRQPEKPEEVYIQPAKGLVLKRRFSIPDSESN